MRVYVSVLSLLLLTLGVSSADYNPLAKGAAATILRTTITYEDGGIKSVPLKVYLPEVKNAPTMLLSHGLGGSREVGAYLAEHWASRGFLVIAMQHPGSDEEIWKAAGKKERLRALKGAANKETFEQRNKDVVATLDALERWNKDAKHQLYKAADLERVAIGGHSFGAVTSQALMGQRYPLSGAKYADSRIKAALLLSPSESKVTRNAKAFGSVKMPVMCMTGTKDEAIVIPGTTAESRKEVYAALPATNNKYQLVLKDAEHMAFSDNSHIGNQPRNPNHHRVIVALSTAFLEAHLSDSSQAMTWLHSGSALENLLEPGDNWEKK